MFMKFNNLALFDVQIFVEQNAFETLLCLLKVYSVVYRRLMKYFSSYKTDFTIKVFSTTVIYESPKILEND